MSLRVLLVVYMVLHSVASFSQPSESMHQKVVASQVAAYMDQSWDAPPEEGLANLRFLVLENGKPVAGVTSLHGRFELNLHGHHQYSTGFNPNSNGRYVFEDIEPGTYTVSIKGAYERAGFVWKREGVVTGSGDAPVLEIELGQ